LAIKTMHCRRGVLSIAGIVLLQSAVANAALDPLLQACAGLGNDFERLACYDKAVAQLSGAALMDTAAKTATPESMFGMGAAVAGTPAPQLPAREELPSIKAAIAQLHAAADGTQLIELDNGQVWRQESSKKLLLKTGDVVTISRAALGSFKLAAPDNRFARVKRVK
jgi:hypothetical protein